jgi:hypothetical protein
MKTQRVKLKVLSVGGVLTSSTVKTTTKKVVLQVVEVPVDNPFGHNKEAATAFEVDVYNHNIEHFQITQALVGEIADCELVINFYKGNSSVQAGPKFIVNDLALRL